MAKSSLQGLFNEYGESHRNSVNVWVHWIAVPLIYFSIVGLLMSIPSTGASLLSRYIWALVGLTVVVLFYTSQSLALAIGMAIYSVICFFVCVWLDLHANWPLWVVCLAIFAMAWIAQFIGHGIEGKKPSFLKDMLFLMVGPAWLMAKLYRRLGIAY